MYLNRFRLNTFGKKQPSHRIEHTPLVNLDALGGTASNGEVDGTEIENMHPAPTSKMKKIILSSILPLIFIIIEIGFWCYNRSDVVDDLVYLEPAY